MPADWAAWPWWIGIAGSCCKTRSRGPRWPASKPNRRLVWALRPRARWIEFWERARGWCWSGAKARSRSQRRPCTPPRAATAATHPPLTRVMPPQNLAPPSAARNAVSPALRRAAPTRFRATRWSPDNSSKSNWFFRKLEVFLILQRAKPGEAASTILQLRSLVSAAIGLDPARGDTCTVLRLGTSPKRLHRAARIRGLHPGKAGSSFSRSISNPGNRGLRKRSDSV